VPQTIRRWTCRPPSVDPKSAFCEGFGVEGVANYLTSRRLPRERTTTVALGDTDPAASETSAKRSEGSAGCARSQP